jgi:hypothetical protein
VASPALRLVVESPAPTDSGFAPVGADYGVFCADSGFPWNKNAPQAGRRRSIRRR